MPTYDLVQTFASSKNHHAQQVKYQQLEAPATVMVRTTLGPSGGAPFQGAPDMVDGLSRVSKMAEEDPVQQRLRTFNNWPPNAPVPKERLALGGFVHDSGLRTKCLSCGVVISDWRIADEVIQRHREASPNCAFVRDLPSLPQSTQGPPVGGARSPTAGDVSRPMQVDCALPPLPEMNESLFLQRLKASEEARFETFYDWPLLFLPPRRMAEAGFYYFHDNDRVRCAFCRGVVHGWEPGDDPLREHARHYPCCPFLLNPEVGRGRDECGHESWQRGRSRPEGERAALLASNGGPNVHLKAPMAHLTKLGVAVHTGPKHPSQASPDARLRSFDKWPATCPKRPPELVKAGFFYIGLQDYTKCFHCDGGLCNWDASDDPWEEHARWFPRCQFVLLNKGEAFIEQCLQRHRSHLNSVAASTSTGPSSDEDAGMSTELAALMQSEDVQFYLSQGVPAETLRAALLRHMRAQNRGFGSRDELLQVLSELLTLPRSSSGEETTVEQLPSSGEATTPPKPSSLPEKLLGVGKVATKSTASLPAEPSTELALENLRLKEQRLCKVAARSPWTSAACLAIWTSWTCTSGSELGSSTVSHCSAVLLFKKRVSFLMNLFTGNGAHDKMHVLEVRSASTHFVFSCVQPWVTATTGLGNVLVRSKCQVTWLRCCAPEPNDTTATFLMGGEKRKNTSVGDFGAR
ncbi:death-associated inhibitor of apoptosis 2-like isoform X2 [Haemaphysalis longicornis]